MGCFVFSIVSRPSCVELTAATRGFNQPPSGRRKTLFCRYHPRVTTAIRFIFVARSNRYTYTLLQVILTQPDVAGSARFIGLALMTSLVSSGG